MHVTTGQWVTPHGLRKMESERADLRQWLQRLKLRAQRRYADRKNKEIALILREEDVVASRLHRLDQVIDRSMVLPASWGHKERARAGDTVYLRCKDVIRAVTLSAIWNADPENGRVSVTSPIGQALLGRTCGDKVRLDTLDGMAEYRILKIV